MGGGEVAVHPVQGDPRPGIAAGLGRQVEHPVTGLDMDRPRVQALLPHPVQCAVKAGELFLGEIHLVRLQGVGHAQVGEGAGDAQMFQPVQPQDGRPVLRRDPQPVHPRVQGQVDLDRLSLDGQGPSMGLVGHRLGELPPAGAGAPPGAEYSPG